MIKKECQTEKNIVSSSLKATVKNISGQFANSSCVWPLGGGAEDHILSAPKTKQNKKKHILRKK